MHREKLSAAADVIREANSVVAMTGAGVSTASGIPDFRSEDGIWTEYDPNDFHISRFRTDPEGFWQERVELVEDLFGGDVEPNAAHKALVDLETAGNLDTLITQNVDGLHQAAGSEDPIEIHGNGQRTVCVDCKHQFDINPVMERVRDGDVPPTCRNCDGALKPDVILFGEALPEDDLIRAQAKSQSADVFLAIGSSLTVQPAASLPRYTLDNGGTLLIVNLDRIDLSSQAAHDFRADVTEVLPALTEAVLDG